MLYRIKRADKIIEDKRNDKRGEQNECDRRRLPFIRRLYTTNSKLF